ncbi:MAG TPA: sugar phosphate isomerase/epimerase family protein [Thermomicrobiales bacterium]|nr:sugar phosphate isomerase/epimerase family protein [Thermomicrobiales bacterium]
MKLGIFETVLARPTFAATLDAVTAAGFGVIQLDYASPGLDSMPSAIPADVQATIRDETVARGIEIAGLHGTYNMIHPDLEVRAAGIASLRALAASCAATGTSIIALSTGTRDATNMWRRHPENDSPEAWDALIEELTKALAIADEFGVTLAFEPEPANVAKSAVKARELLDQVHHPRLKICFDAANIAASDLTRDPRLVIDDAFELLGDDIVLAHGKDITASGEFCPAGTGIVPWAWCIERLGEIGYDGALILHSLKEADIPRAVAAMTPGT